MSTTPFITALSRACGRFSNQTIETLEEAHQRSAAADEVIKLYDHAVAALQRAQEDLMDIQEDLNSGEFEIDPQFAIDRISAALKELAERQVV